jgi:hypothetical protein
MTALGAANVTGEIAMNMRRIIASIAGLAAVAVIVLVAITARSYRQNEQATQTYDGIKLGDPRAEVRYRKGEPEQVFGPDEAREQGMPDGWDTWQRVYYVQREDDPSENKVNVIPKGKTPEDFDAWSYPIAAGGVNAASLEVNFDKGRVTEIRCIDFLNSGRCGPVLGITSGTSEAALRSALGEPSNVILSSDGSVKTITYGPLGLEFLLQVGKVYAVKLTGKGERNFNLAILRASLL